MPKSFDKSNKAANIYHLHRKKFPVVYNFIIKKIISHIAGGSTSFTYGTIQSIHRGGASLRPLVFHVWS